METREEFINRINSIPTFQEKSVWSNIDGYDYKITRKKDVFEVLHCVMRSSWDWNYGTSVCELLPLGYFSVHSVSELYDTIAIKQECHTPKTKDYLSRKREELPALTSALKGAGWLPD